MMRRLSIALDQPHVSKLLRFLLKSRYANDLTYQWLAGW